MVNIATMGKFAACCGGRVVGGGAPPYRPNEQERVTPLVLVRNVEVKTIRTSDEIIKRIRVKLLDID
jgi:hypothetical protein